MRDATWIVQALRDSVESTGTDVAFDELLTPLVEAADCRLWHELTAQARAHLTDAAIADLHPRCSPTSLSLRPRSVRTIREAREGGQTYREFVIAMKTTGFARLFDDKPVLLRLIASLIRQWIDASCELIVRLDTDLMRIRRDLLGSAVTGRLARVQAQLSDPHHFGRTVAILEFEDGSRVVYKPKDLGSMWRGAPS